MLSIVNTNTQEGGRGGVCYMFTCNVLYSCVEFIPGTVLFVTCNVYVLRQLLMYFTIAPNSLMSMFPSSLTSNNPVIVVHGSSFNRSLNVASVI